MKTFLAAAAAMAFSGASLAADREYPERIGETVGGVIGGPVGT